MIPSRGMHAWRSYRSFTTDTSAHVGFIGLGLMGAPMANHLLQAGCKLVVYDTNAKALDMYQKQDSRIAQSPADVADKCDTIITMLPSISSIRQVYLDMESGIISRLRSEHVLVDSSTTCPIFTQELESNLKKSNKSVTFMDAPVSGGTMGAQNATLTFMVGAESEANVDTVRPILNKMGKSIVHCGGNSTGQVAKICNNLAFAIQMASVSEAMILGVKLGIQPSVLQGIMNTSTSSCFSSRSYHPYPGLTANAPASNNYRNGFSTQLCRKDLGLAVDCANRAEVSLPLTFTMHQTYNMMVQKGYGSRDFSFIYPFLSDVEHRK